MEEHTCDVLVVGSGAGGLSAAVVAAHARQNVLVVEKEPVFGGTTARSGGWMWIPGNAPGRRAGINDSAEKARTYLQHEAGEHFDAERVDAFLENGPKAVDFFETQTELQFDLGPTFSDYHPMPPAACRAAAPSWRGRMTAADWAKRSIGCGRRCARSPSWA